MNATYKNFIKKYSFVPLHKNMNNKYVPKINDIILPQCNDISESTINYYYFFKITKIQNKNTIGVITGRWNNNQFDFSKIACTSWDLRMRDVIYDLNSRDNIFIKPRFDTNSLFYELALDFIN